LLKILESYVHDSPLGDHAKDDGEKYLLNQTLKAILERRLKFL